MAKIDGDSKLNQGITWTIKGQNSVQTKITADGVLTIAENEKNKNITVRATSQGDTTKYAQAVVTVDQEMEEPLKEVVTGISITPRDVEIIRGRSVMFSSQVTGINVANRKVHYSITGNTSGNTTIDDTGLLKVAANELSKLIVVKVASDADPVIVDSTTVTTVVEADAKNPMAVSKVEVQPTSARIGVGLTYQFAAIVRGEMNPP